MEKIVMTEEEIKKDASAATKSHVFKEIEDAERHIAAVSAILKEEE